MVAGVRSIRDRWSAMLQPADAIRFAAGARHEYFDEGGRRSAAGTIPRGTIVVNSRAIPALPVDLAKASRQAASCTMWRLGDHLSAVRLASPLDAGVLMDG